MSVNTKAETLERNAALFASVHPVLAKLEAANSDFQQRLKKLADDQIARLQAMNELSPLPWTRKIEAAGQNPEALDVIRIQYDETSLTLLSEHLCFENSKRAFIKSRWALQDAINEALATLDSLQLSGSPARRFFQARIYHAIAIYEEGNSRKWQSEGSIVDAAHSALGVQEQAFNVLFNEAQRERPFNNAWYTDLPANQPKMMIPFCHPHKVDLRRVLAVPFTLDATKFPASARLSALLGDYEAGIKESHEAAYSIQDDRSKVQEPEYAKRLIYFLRSGDPGGNLAHHIQCQKAARLSHEMFRQHFSIAEERLAHIRMETVLALREAVVEAAKSLNELSSTPVPPTAKSPVDYRSSAVGSLVMESAAILMNNCLAADFSLRYWARSMNSLRKSIAPNHPSRAGEQVLEQAFNELLEKSSFSSKRKSPATPVTVLPETVFYPQ